MSGRSELLFASPRHFCRDEGNSASPVEFTAVADVMEKDAAEFHVEFVKHPVIADAQFEFRPALPSLVWERFQARAHFIHLALHGFADGRGKLGRRRGKKWQIWSAAATTQLGWRVV